MGALVRRIALCAAGLAAAAGGSWAQVVQVVTIPFDQPDPETEVLALLNDARRQAGLVPLRAEPALAQVAARRAQAVAASGDFDADAETAMALSRDLRRAGYPPYSWRQRLVQGPHDAASLVRQWRESDPQGFAEIALGDFEGFGAARAPAVEPPLWSLFVALPRITWERREAAPLDDVAAVQTAVLAAVNRERAHAGLPALSLDPRLDDAAQTHAGDMLARHFYDHVTPEGHNLAYRFVARGYGFSWAAENIAKGVFTPIEVVRRWMLSSGHRRNILDPHPVSAGIGVARGEENGRVTALWVLDLGSPGPR